MPLNSTEGKEGGKHAAPRKQTKYVVVTGGVISGVGKGIIASSTGVLLRALRQRVTAIKIDPYLNIDAGTLSPLDHGEVFVLEDGGEVDLDLGNYERFIDVTLTRDNSLSLGKVYEHVLARERMGGYLGKTVQVVPHVTDAIQDWIERVASRPVHAGARAEGDAEEAPDVCVIELGGTVGEIEGAPFVEALRQFQFRVGRENFMLIHVCLVPSVSDEQKSKPTQMSVRDLRSAGLTPDVIACRSTAPLEPSVRAKIAMFCHVPPQHIMAVHDCASVYHVPLLLAEQGMDAVLAERLCLGTFAGRTHAAPMPALMESLSPTPQMRALALADADYFAHWAARAQSFAAPDAAVTVAIVGKYTFLHDSYISIIKALNHAGMALRADVRIAWIEASDLEEPVVVSKRARTHALRASTVGVSYSHLADGEPGASCTESESEASPAAAPMRSFVSSSINGTPLLDATAASSGGACMPVLAPASPRSALSPAERHEAAWAALRSAGAIIVPGGFGERGTEGKIAALRYARESHKPLLGICLGFQLAVVEHARAVLGWERANSVELDPSTPHPVVVNMPEVSSIKLGGTMRLGARDSRFVVPECVSRTLYGAAVSADGVISERHRHRYEVNPALADAIATQGLVFVAKDADAGTRMEILERPDHPFFVATQFHPEFLSRPLRPAPLFVGLVQAALSAASSTAPSKASSDAN